VRRAAQDPYCYPGTQVLRNLLDIRDAAALDLFEGALVAIRLVHLRENPIGGPCDVKRLLETHRRMFDGVYPWAGCLRRDTGTMTKHRTSGTIVTYADSAYVEASIHDLFRKLEREEGLKGLDLDRFSLRAAYFYGELDAIHPFREGNSRTLREFFVDLACNAGYWIDWTQASDSEDKRQRVFLARDLAVMRGDTSLLASIFRENLRPIEGK
jgi:cell filamentation protein